MRAWERWLPEIVIAATVGSATAITLAVFARVGTITWAFSVVWGIATLSSLALVGAVRRSGNPWRQELKIFVGVGFAFGLFGIFTGIGNNATDEPFAIGGYLAELLHGQDPYSTQLSITYTVYYLNFWSQTIHSSTTYTYLPLLLFFQIPGTGFRGYDLVCLAAWGGIVYLVREDEYAALSLGSPIVALLASNGFTDLPVLLLVTFSLRGSTRNQAAGKAVEYVSYGMKQFANAFWFIYYLVKRDIIQAVAVVGITLLIALPFILWHPTTGIWCEALSFSLSPGCSSAANSMRHISDLYSHWNYYLWILWGYVLFRQSFNAAGRRAWVWLRRAH